MRTINLPPKPASLIESMRDIGYSIETAVADIIDNSITACANSINVRFSWNHSEPWIAIIDDGYGMDESTLINAMRLGSANPLEIRNSEDLGRFGLGLKTASFSQCRKLTVLSKRNENISAAQWDLESLPLDSNNEWTLKFLESHDIQNYTILYSLFNSYLSNSISGTIVLWQSIDRLEEKTSSKSKESHFNETIDNVKSHLELVYHRFLSSEPGCRRVDIFFNENKINGFDPFNVNKSAELRLEKFQYGGEVILVQPYILPHHNKISKTEWKKFAGKQGYLHEQGFYIYRNKRLIIYGTWFRLMPKDELTKLIRIKVDIPNSMDHLWRIDIKKSNAFPPSGIRESLKNIIGKIEVTGKRVYKQRGQKLIDSTKVPIWNRIIKEGQIHYEINRDHPFFEKLIEQSTESGTVIIDEYFSLLETSFPRDMYYNDAASDPDSFSEITLDKSKIETLLSFFIPANDIRPSKEKLREILSMDPFASYRELTELIFKERNYDF